MLCGKHSETVVSVDRKVSKFGFNMLKNHNHNSFLTIMINFDLTFKVACLFFESGKLLLLLQDLGSGDNCPGLVTSPWFTLVGLIISVVHS